MRRAAMILIGGALALAAGLSACSDDGDRSATPTIELGNHFEATAARPYSFDYPSTWEAGGEREGDAALGIDDTLGMVLEPVHPWGGLAGFNAPGVQSLTIDGYPAYRMQMGGSGEGQALAYRINANGTNATIWFFAKNPAAYDDDLFQAIIETFTIEERLLPS